jgi:DNA-binding MarR family transcriptional regulator
MPRRSQPAAAPTGAASLISPLHKASRQVQLHLEPACLEHGVSFAEAHLVAFVVRYPSRVSLLSRVFDMRKSTLTSRLDRLEGLGLVRRATDPVDGRSFVVSATARGERLAQAIGPSIARFESAVRESVSRRDIEGFLSVLQAIGRISGVEVR